jgi:Chromo (CHRromatin Organisation MOdifier) domain
VEIFDSDRDTHRTVALAHVKLYYRRENNNTLEPVDDDNKTKSINKYLPDSLPNTNPQIGNDLQLTDDQTRRPQRNRKLPERLRDFATDIELDIANTKRQNAVRPFTEVEDICKNYSVESIINHKRVGRKYTYLVKWEGFPETENSWIPAKNFTSQKALLEYWNDARDAVPPEHIPKAFKN